MENLTRIQSEIRRFDDEREGVLNEAKNAKADVEKKRQDIEEIKKTILNSTDYQKEQENALKEHTRKKEEMSASYKGFFQKQEDAVSYTHLDVYKRQDDLKKCGADRTGKSVEDTASLCPAPCSSICSLYIPTGSIYNSMCIYAAC